MFSFKNGKFAIIVKIFLIYLFLAVYQNVLLASSTVWAKETIIPILTYHNFTSDESSSYRINDNEFEKQMEYLAVNDYSVISLKELIKGLENGFLPPKPVVITIDDGYKSTYTLAYPILKKYNFPATLFLYTDFIEKNNYSLTWNEVKKMAQDNIVIGSHTLSHCNLLKCKKNENYENYLARIRKEIFLSKNILENKIGEKVDHFAYPYGTYSSTIKDLVLQAGY
ncbi:MAG: polysaccharide deacetylase family protein, partial [Candidatus Caldatribacteriota bacterium]|nr:polysaccharide deacetylase family protein [Candidatus Caldatribacteriota bacterium]